MSEPLAVPEVHLFMLNPEAPPPVPASSTINGSLPVRASQLCPPVTAASGFGWYLFPPVDFALRWDGQESWFSLLEDNEASQWRSLAGGKDVFLPEELSGGVPADRRAELQSVLPNGRVPFVNADPRGPHRVELHFGLIVQTSLGWSTLVRSVPNWPYAGYQIIEGIIETAWYRSILPVMVQFTQPDRVVRFYRTIPAAALQVVPDIAYATSTAKQATIHRGISEIPEDVWSEWLEMRGERHRHERPGNYKRRQHRHAVLTGTASTDGVTASSPDTVD